MFYEGRPLFSRMEWPGPRHCSGETASLTLWKCEIQVQSGRSFIATDSWGWVGAQEFAVLANLWTETHVFSYLWGHVDTCHCYQKEPLGWLFLKCKALLVQLNAHFLWHLICLSTFQSAPLKIHFSNIKHWGTCILQRGERFRCVFLSALLHYHNM